MNILVTGGMGFIGSHLVDELVKENEVTIIDNLSSTKIIPEYYNKKAKFIQEDLCEIKELDDYDIIFHNASVVGIGQSNYDIKRFVYNNCTGTANLLQLIINKKKKPKLIISASNTAYGEGLYNCCGEVFHPDVRISKKIRCPKCRNPNLEVIPISEEEDLKCNSIYSQTKKSQEEYALLLGKLYNFPVIVLRYFNVYGPRQSLSNPYTGVSAIFMSRVKNYEPILIYEDGKQTRDFIYIKDVVNANIRAMISNISSGIFNIGTGVGITINELAEIICRIENKRVAMNITSEFRIGDIRHCTADISKAKYVLRWNPEYSIEQGLKELSVWAKNQRGKSDVEIADKELKERGLISR